MTVIIDGGAGITFPDTRQQTNATTNTGGNPLYYGVRAWVNFNGANGAIRASVGISSVTRTGLGRYTITFSPAMPDANYCVVGVSSAANSGSNAFSIGVNETTPPTTTQLRVKTCQGTADVDPDFCNIVVLR